LKLFLPHNRNRRKGKFRGAGMKKRMVYISIIFSLLIGCQPSQEPKEVVDSPSLSEGVVKERENPVPYQIDEIQQIETPFESFGAVVEWLNDETVLYITCFLPLIHRL
jgi:hypothetical protein